MILRLFIFVFALLLSLNGCTQDMRIGYNYLEKGQYQKALVYFDSVRNVFPDNKTAKLCYGRAIGLNGNPIKASSIFMELMHTHPDDFEVKLNYAESLLWNKKYLEAKSYYADLLKINSQSFEANLGYSSSLFQLATYDTALVFINKAIQLKDKNPNALISKKYIQLELANEFMLQEKYEEALILLKGNLLFFNNDKETLFKMVDIYMRINRLNSAKKIYKKIIAHTQDSLIGLDGLSLVYHLKGRNKKALKISLIASQLTSIKQNKEQTQQVTKRYIEALIWNQRYKKASNMIEELLASNPDKNWLLFLRATLNMYKGEFKKSIVDFDEILLTDSTSFNANFGKANALFAYEKYDLAYEAAQRTLLHHKQQKEVLEFLEKLNRKFTPSIENKTAFSMDIGSNNSISNKTLLSFPLSTRFSLLGDLNYRNTNNTLQNNKASSINLLGGCAYQIKSYTYLTIKVGSAVANSVVENYSNLSSEVVFKTKPFSKHFLEIGSIRKYEDFNTDLIEKGIFHNHFYLNYNLTTQFNLGWFTQYYFTLQSDNNTRNLLFTSLYYNVLKKPLFKIGVNYQNIQFKNQLPTVYFSPSKFYALEGFINVLKDENASKKGIFYSLTAASGLQFIEDNDNQLTYRIQAKLGYKINERSLFNFYGSHSNIASTTAAGFTITEAGFRFIFHFGKKPLFKYRPLK